MTARERLRLIKQRTQAMYLRKYALRGRPALADVWRGSEGDPDEAVGLPDLDTKAWKRAMRLVTLLEDELCEERQGQCALPWVTVAAEE